MTFNNNEEYILPFSPNIHNYDEIKYIAFKNNYSLKRKNRGSYLHYK